MRAADGVRLLIPLVLVARARDPAQLAAQDTVVVRADNAPVWGTPLGLVEEVRIGRIEGDEAYLLGRVAGVTVGPDGVIWVADSQARMIRRYRPDGTHLDDIGRQGGGPGEFEDILGMKPLPGGGAAVWDPRQQRVSRFAADGSFADQVRVESGLYSADVFQTDTAGGLYVKTVDHTRTDFGAPTDPTMVWIRVSSAGAVIDSVDIPNPRVEGPGYVFALPFGRLRAFSRLSLSTMSPHGYLVWGRNDAYALHRGLPDGRLVRIERTWTPIEVSGDERDQWQAWSDFFVRRAREGGREAPGYPPVPRTKPPFWALTVDEEGRIWVARHVAARFVPETPEDVADREARGSPPFTWQEPLVTDVLDPRGRLMGTLEFPVRRTAVVAARGRTVWVLEQGPLREPYVVRYRIEGGG